MSERVHHMMNSSQGSNVTLTQDSHVRRRTCQQISMNFGCTRKCYPLNQATLLVGPESVPRGMRPETLQYIHEGHQGKGCCLLRAKNTHVLAQDTYDIQQLIEKCMICQEYGKSQPLIGTTQELPHFHGTHWQQICSIGKEWTF